MCKTVLIEVNPAAAAMMFAEMLQWAANQCPQSQEKLIKFNNAVEAFNKRMMAEDLKEIVIPGETNELVNEFRYTVTCNREHPEFRIVATPFELKWYTASDCKVLVYRVDDGLIVHITAEETSVSTSIENLPQFIEAEMPYLRRLKTVAAVLNNFRQPTEVVDDKTMPVPEKTAK